MTESVLGKITKAEFGTMPDHPFLFGLQLYFSLAGGGVGCGGKYTVNISKECKWNNSKDRADTFVERLEDLELILKEAKVNHVSQLVNKPVEIFLEDNCFAGFRILTEVL